MEFNVALYKEDFVEICKLIYSKAYNVIMHMIAVIYIIIGSVCLIIKENEIIAIAFILLAIFTEIGSAIRKKKFIKIIIARTLETTGNIEPVEYSYKFDESCIFVSNKTTGGQTELKYIAIEKYVESKKFFVILTKAKQFFVIYKDEASKENLKEFLNNRMKNNK